ncbi:MAG: SufS family cysteine desulfurase [Bradymonadales bacterium]|nr:MAG: SufS family cysteine desulfurase [Bradymonadales bacterium]
MSLQVSELNSFSVERLRSEFPILKRSMGPSNLVYLDNAATLQRPRRVVDREREFSLRSNANVHRSAHRLSFEATELFEEARKKLANSLGATDSHELIFTKGATEAINCVAQTWGMDQLQEGQEVIISRAEHHANFVPWQQLCRRKKLKLQILELDAEARIQPSALEGLLNSNTALVALTALSNVTGAKTPLGELIPIIRAKTSAKILIDACQALLYETEFLKNYPVDFLVGSGHKMGAPTGIGFLWGKRELLEAMPPYQLGGEMISVVYDSDSRWSGIPYKFEAGTPPISQAIAWGECLRFWEEQNRDWLDAHLKALTERALKKLEEVSELRILGPLSAKDRHPTFSFSVEGVHPHDLVTFLDSKGIAIRGGHHCAQPLHRQMGFGSSARASLTYYNQEEEVDLFVEALKESILFFRRLSP